jgi:serine/threonine-protein kinase
MQSPQDLIGRTLQGKFVITDLLGEGAMGVVYRGFDEIALREVAIKVLQPQLAVHPELVARFYREGAAARRVDHANTVRFLGKGQDDGVHFLVMELLDGRSLGELLESEIRIGQGRAARMIVQICGALSVAHERGIVHRDLKPENVMVCGSPGSGLGEHVKLLDFGIAKRVTRPVGVEDSFNMEELTACGSLVGTPEYMAPEQCRGHEVDARTDVYACGVMLYRMVTGRVPFWAEHLLQICQMHLGEAPVPPSALAPGIHPMIEAVILKAMSKHPADRQQSAAALRDELNRALEVMASVEEEATGVIDRGSLVPAEMLAPAAVDLAATVPDVAEPATLLYEPPPRRRANMPMLAFYAALGAGMASLVITLTALLHH